MMSIEALISILLCVALVLLSLGPWRDWCTAMARQVIFEKRDAIFDLAADGKLDFTSSEYRTIRSSLETIIRFAHELTLTRFAFLGGYMDAHRSKASVPELRIALEALGDDDTAKAVKRYVYEAQRAMIIMMVAKSPLALLAGAVVALVSFCVAGVRASLRPHIRAVGDRIVEEAAKADEAADDYGWARAA